MNSHQLALASNSWMRHDSNMRDAFHLINRIEAMPLILLRRVTIPPLIHFPDSPLQESGLIVSFVLQAPLEIPAAIIVPRTSAKTDRGD